MLCTLCCSSATKPAILRSFDIADAALDRKSVLARSLIPGSHDLGPVIRVDRQQPAVVTAFDLRQPGVTMPLRARPGPVSAAIGAPDQLRDALNQDAQTVLAFSQRILGAMMPRDVVGRAEPFSDLPVSIQDGDSAGVGLTHGALLPHHLVFQVKRGLRFDGSIEDGLDTIAMRYSTCELARTRARNCCSDRLRAYSILIGR